MTKKLKPIHPGEILTEDFLKPMRLTSYAVAASIGVPRTRIERLARQQTAMTASTARRLGRFFKVSPAFWMNIQTRYDLERADDEGADDLDAITPHQAAEDLAAQKRATAIAAQKRKLIAERKEAATRAAAKKRA